MEELENLLHSGDYSCVIRNAGITRFFSERGVTDLFNLLRNEPEFLEGAIVADKVVGKAVAALLIEGGISELYTDLISTSALQLLGSYNISVTFSLEVPHIANRQKNGMCPLEAIAKDSTSTKEIIRKIKDFLENNNK